MRLRTLLIALLSPAVVLLTAAIPAESPSRCPDLVAHALTSTDLIPGSYACLQSGLQFQASLAGYDGDGGLQKLAGDRGYHSARYLGRTDDGAAVYEFSGSGSSVLVVLWLDASGKVTRIDQDQKAP
jgi:hypothetical protein